MGTRDNYETVTRVIQAFVRQNTWAQKELARHVGIETPALRRVLAGLHSAHMPLERQEDHPHVYWSVPKKWFPGGVIFDVEDWPVLVHAVLRIPDKARRHKLLRRLLAGQRPAPNGDGALERLSRTIAATPVTTEEHDKVLVIERALLEGAALSIKYYSSNHGRLDWRVVSPQKVFPEPPGRMVAVCHETDELKWFRIDNMQRVEVDAVQPLRSRNAEVIDAYLHSSVDGFNDGTDEINTFRVRAPEARWVRGNLLPGMSIDPSSTGSELRVVCRGAALVVARFIVGLGGAAVAEEERLRALIRALASEALESNKSALP